MAYLPTEFCKQVATARRQQGITQSALAKSVGCKQSAISMFESGHPEKLSLEVVERIAKTLKIPFEKQSPLELPEIPLTTCTQQGYCPNTACLSNIPYIIAGELLIWPQLTGLSDEVKYCATCGEVLERCCPGCESPVTKGACCEICGHPRVMAALPPGTNPEQWAAKHRDKIQQWRQLTDNSNL